MKSDLKVFVKNRPKVMAALKAGDIDYVDGTSWSFSDKFFAFLISIGFFKFSEETYPSFRQRKNIPLWILIGLMFQLKLSRSNSFYKLPGILKSGAVLTRTNFNIGMVEGGFNRKNRRPRTKGEIANQDTLRKYYKDTDAGELTRWYNIGVSKFFSSKRAIRKEGIFILDGSILSLPDNINYENAQYLPLDGDKNYINTDKTPPYGVKPTLCHKMVNLLHISKEADYFIFCANRVVGSKSHDKPAGEDLVDEYVKNVGKDKIKLLIMDRAFLSAAMISRFKSDYGIDTLIPLKKNMDAAADAEGLLRLSNVGWKKVDEATYCYMAKKIRSYEGVSIDLNVILVRSTQKNGKVRLWSLATTKNYRGPADAVADYRLRWQIEERYRQIKASWFEKGFNSTSFNLVAAHILFTLLVYSLIQIYLNISSLNHLANKTIESLMAEESVGENTVIMHKDGYYAVLDTGEALYQVAELEGKARERFRKWIRKFLGKKPRMPDGL